MGGGGGARTIGFCFISSISYLEHMLEIICCLSEIKI